MRRLEVSLLGPLRPSINDLARLASGGGDQRQERLRELIDWRVQRAMTVAKGIVGTAASFAAALFLSLFKNELHIKSGVLIAALVASLFVASFGIYIVRRLVGLNSAYGAMLSLLRLLP